MVQLDNVTLFCTKISSHKRYSENFNAHYQVKEANLKNLHTFWYIILEKRTTMETILKKSMIIVVTYFNYHGLEGERDEQTKHSRFLRQ